MNASTTGGFENAEFDEWKGAFENDILQSFAAKSVQIFGDRMTNAPTTIRAVIKSVTNDSYNQMMYRQFLCSIGNVVCGDYIKDGDRWWLCVSLVDNNGVYEKGILYFCNTIINFTSPETFQTVSYPAVVHNATQYNSGERSTDYLTTVSSQKLIYLPANSETVLLDNDYRFIIDKNSIHPSVWKIAQADTENDFWDGHGIMRIMAAEDEFNSTVDNIEDRIADNSRWLSSHIDGYASRNSDGGGWIDLPSGGGA